jgi:cobalt/nickel transport protein
MSHRFAYLLALLCSLSPGPVLAHFQTLLPHLPIVSEPSQNPLQLTLQFTHPMTQGPLMHMAAPVQFGVSVNGETQDLRDRLTVQHVDKIDYYQASYSLTQPGDHLFFVEPAPYWEPAEGKLIIHYTKVIVDGFGAETGWDTRLGLPVEIEPLVRPYGLWTGNSFRGIVRHKGQAVPYATIEVEYYNSDGVAIPADPFTTQVIKADGNGVFSYSLARAGWWGFAALIEADSTQANPDGEQVPVELGGLLWIHSRDMQP